MADKLMYKIVPFSNKNLFFIIFVKRSNHRLYG
jgi:hypothetical protein